MKTLQVISCAYRATAEEQDDTVVWLSHALKDAGADLDVMLRGNAVNYTVAGQNADGLAFGDWRQTRPPRMPSAIAGLLEKGVKVHAVAEDIADRGLADVNLIDGIQTTPRSAVASLICRYDRVWQW